MLTYGYPTNETVLTRTWLKSVNTLCIKIKNEANKAVVRDRLAIYNSILNMTWEEERKFWNEDPRAFQYPRLEIPGGDKFSRYYKKLEFAQFKMAAYGRHLKVALEMETSIAFDELRFAMDLKYRLTLEDQDTDQENEPEAQEQDLFSEFPPLEITPLSPPGKPAL